MPTDPKARTLYDDWKARRERLARASGGVAGYRAAEMRFLDYLLRRYQGSPEAARPARFPLPTRMFINHRAIVVHRHLGRGRIPTISTRQEALAHVRAMVERVWSAFRSAETAVADEDIAECAIPPPADPVEESRKRLCDGDPLVRIQAAVELGMTGDLDDIGLLSDLLSLPASADEHPREREALLHAMQRLSGATRERFDLSGVLPAYVPPTPLPAPDAGTTGTRTHRADLYFYLILIALAAILFAVGGIMLSLARRGS